MGRSHGHPAVKGVGRRPWLQKLATMTTAVSLTIATADTFHVAENQYKRGFVDSTKLVDAVIGSDEIRVIQVIAYTFLWLAQVQTLIRLFPRHKEKVTIKWLGFALVTLDTLFSILVDFVDDTVRTRPRSFQDAIPALNYLFDLAISLIYAACVIYYSISKRRFAFWHSKMRNICLMAFLSYTAILIPVVFFILDVANPDLAGWGDYIRWVGAAAASVVVWEWVERIEALERDERKDGILGREIFDGDEMLDDWNSDDADWPARVSYRERSTTPSENVPRLNQLASASRLPNIRFRLPQTTRRQTAGGGSSHSGPSAVLKSATDALPTVPPLVASPISRSDTTSAASTIYAVRFHPNAPAFVPQDLAQRRAPVDSIHENDLSAPATELSVEQEKIEEPSHNNTSLNPAVDASHTFWRAVQNPFKRKRMIPPAEVADAQLARGDARRSPVEKITALRSRATALASARRYLGSGRHPSQSTEQLSVTVIPAQRRGGRVWSPDDLGRSQERDSNNDIGQTSVLQAQHDTSLGTWTRPSHEALSVTVIPAPIRRESSTSPDDLNGSSPARRDGATTESSADVNQDSDIMPEPMQGVAGGLSSRSPKPDDTPGPTPSLHQPSANQDPSSNHPRTTASPSELSNPDIHGSRGS